MTCMKPRASPHDFDWLMKNVAYGITEKFDWPSELLVWGEIRGVDSNMCIDSMGHKGQYILRSFAVYRSLVYVFVHSQT